MKKLTALCVIACVFMALAQTADARRFGVKAGANVTSLDFNAGMPPTLGYSAGITWQWDLPLGFAIQPDLLYHVKATSLSEITRETFGLGYVELPVNLQWGIRVAQKNLRIFAQASPFIGYAVAQTGSVESINTGNTYVDEFIRSQGVDKWANINRFSYGAGLGLGVQLWALQVTAQYNWNLGKLVDIRNTTLADFNDKNFGGYTITVAVMLDRKAKNK